MLGCRLLGAAPQGSHAVAWTHTLILNELSFLRSGQYFSMACPICALPALLLRSLLFRHDAKVGCGPRQSG